MRKDVSSAILAIPRHPLRLDSHLGRDHRNKDRHKTLIPFRCMVGEATRKRADSQERLLSTDVCHYRCSWRVLLRPKRLCLTFFRQLPHPDISMTWDGSRQLANVRAQPPIAVAFVPKLRLDPPRFFFGFRVYRLVIHHRDDAARPTARLFPCRDDGIHPVAVQSPQPCFDAVILGAAELLGNAHRATPPRRNRQTTAVLHTLQPRHDQDGVCAGAGKGVDDHLPYFLIFNSSGFTVKPSAFSPHVTSAGCHAWSFPMNSHGARDARSPRTNCTPYHTCDRNTPVSVTIHLNGFGENVEIAVNRM